MQSGTLSGSLMPPSRKPFETWRFSLVFSLASKLAMNRGAKPSAEVSPSVKTSGGAGGVVAEDAVEELGAVLVEVVVAHAAGQLEALGGLVAELAEDRQLVEVVVEVGVEEHVESAPPGRGWGCRRCG